ncbi:MAG: hypothetical protein JW723_07550 [Bacteroidales bacterium]|nr:hypothetical protein [Bacteroidales bacterium]
MKRFEIYLKVVFAVLIIFSSCKQAEHKGTDVIDYETIQLDENKEVIPGFDTIGEGLPIFYNMYLTVEMESLFESVHAVFDQDLLNRSEKAADYITASKKALNLGVYAVDLSYCRIFEQFEMAGRYFSAMQRLSEELGIPSDYFINTAKRFDRNINNKDSLIEIANEVYMTTDSYLKKNEQYSASAQIILGGWIEAIYIASNVALESKDIDIIERYAEQKYSLKNLLEMLSNYPDDEVIGLYVRKLREIDIIYSTFVLDIHEELDPESAKARRIIDKALVKIRQIGELANALREETIE